MKETNLSLYKTLKANAVPIDHHESDLYVKATPEALEILEKFGVQIDGWNASYFYSNVDGERWIDIPFQYDPYWKNKP